MSTTQVYISMEQQKFLENFKSKQFLKVFFLFIEYNVLSL